MKQFDEWYRDNCKFIVNEWYRDKYCKAITDEQLEEAFRAGMLAAADMIMPSDRPKTYIEFYYLKGSVPFICGADGHITVDFLEGIESDWTDCPEEVFTKGDGSYLFLASSSKYDNGQTYWELDLISHQEARQYPDDL